MNISKILVVVDPYGDNTNIIKRAETFSSRHKAGVELAVFDYRLNVVLENFYSAEKLEQAKHDFLLEKLKPMGQLAEKLGIPSERITCHLEWAHPLHEAILSRAQEIKADLIIKQTHHHGVINRSIFTHTDWHLIRASGTPLLFVKDRDYDTTIRIGAAVDPIKETGEDGTCPLSHQLLDATHALCSTLPGELHVIHTFEVAPTGLLLELDELASEVEEIKVAVKKRHEVAMQRLLSADVEVSAQLHFEEGDVRQLLPNIAEESGLDIVVMGGMSRGRLAQLTVGSTTEYVLDRLPCDVLVLK